MMDAYSMVQHRQASEFCTEMLALQHGEHLIQVNMPPAEQALNNSNHADCV